MFYKRVVNSSAYLVLGQVGNAGDMSAVKLNIGRTQRQILVELLNEYYPNEHKVCFYECSVWLY
jgi:hypothetical protein